MRTTTDEVVRFIGFVSSDRTTGCWNWVGVKDRKGYGKFWTVDGKTWKAHLFALSRWRTEEYTKLKLYIIEPDHLCKNVACCNPYHLEMVTRRENLRRGSSPVALNMAKKMCIHGHPFTPENTYLIPQTNGLFERRCKTCNRLKARAAYQADPEKFRERKRQYEANKRLGQL